MSSGCDLYPHDSDFWIFYLLLAAGLNDWRGLLELGIVSEVKKILNQSTIGSMLSVKANVTIIHCVSNHRWIKFKLKGTVCLQVLFLSSEHLSLSLKVMTIKWHIIIFHYHFTFFLNLFCFWVFFVILRFTFRRFVVYFFYIFRLLYQI
jgi:hypothetical protein